MGNNDSFNNKKTSLLAKIKQIIDLKEDTKKYIADSYNKNCYYFYDTTKLKNWVQNIMYYIDNIYKGKYEEIVMFINEEEKNQTDTSYKYKNEEKQKNIYNYNLKGTKEYSSKTTVEKTDIITSKDIQIKNLEITRQFESFSINFIDDEDSIDNKTLGLQLIQVANISRSAYNDSNKLLAQLFNDFEKFKNKEYIIQTNDQFRKDFSSWVKNPKNKNYIENSINKLCSTFVINEEDKDIRNYFIKLYKDLLTLYFLCQLSFPLVEINFTQEEKDFNSKKMIDSFQIGKRHKAKVNFVFFPSLYSNGNYLENGKQWVFSYINTEKKVTFHKEGIKFVSIIGEKEKFIIPKVKDKLKISLKKEILYTISTNFKFSENCNKEFIIFFKNKSINKISKISADSSFKLDENEEIEKIDFNMTE